MQVLIPISGRSAFFPEDEYFFPKPLVEVAGSPMIELVINQFKQHSTQPRFIFVVDREDVRSFSLDRTLHLAAGPGATVVERLGPTSGALCSCLLAVEALDLDAPLVISNCDQVFSQSLASHFDQFWQSETTAGVITFDSVHPRWSYIVEGEAGEVIHAVEKKVVSRNAIAGVYFFRTARDFVEAAKQVMLKDIRTGDQFFISSALNEVLLAANRVRHASIGAETYHSFYSPARINSFERSPNAQAFRRVAIDTPPAVNVIIPAAGEGSRFANEGWKKRKPFIDLNGQPMLSHVIDNVSPPNAQITLLLRDEDASLMPGFMQRVYNDGINLRTVPELTEGTACTVLLARPDFDNDKPMIVANSDQLVDFDISDFVFDCLKRQLDGSILVFKDPSADPKWSFARTDDSGLVLEVAEKKPVSDLATVGIYMFARGRDFVAAAADMIARNDRVKNEFYVCPVYNYMIADGARIGVYEVEMDAMSCLGTPKDLRDYLKKIGAPASVDSP